MTQRVKCTSCGVERLDPEHACRTCGEALEWKAVKPSPGDLEAIKDDVIEAAQKLNALFRSGLAVTHDNTVLTAFKAVVREWEWAREGILLR